MQESLMRIKILIPILVVATLAAAAPARASTLRTPVVTQTGCTPFWSSFQGVTGLWLPEAGCYFQTGSIAYFGNSRLALQTDGNLVIYAIDSGRAAWDSHSYGAISNVYMIWGYAGDGELTIHKYQSNGFPASIWSAGIGPDCMPPFYPHSEKFLAFQSDGNMVIYCVDHDTGETTPLWDTGTWMH